MQKRYLLGFVFFVGVFSAAPALAQNVGVKSPQNANQKSAAVAPTNAPTKKVKHKKPRVWKPLTAAEVSRLEYWQRVRYLRKLRERALLVDKINRQALKLHAYIEQNKNKRTKKRKVAEASAATKSAAWWELYILQPVADFLHARAWPMPRFLKAYVLIKETSAQSSNFSSFYEDATILNCGEVVRDAYEGRSNPQIGKDHGVPYACLSCDENNFRCSFATTGLVGQDACVSGRRNSNSQTYECMEKRDDLREKESTERDDLLKKLTQVRQGMSCDLSDPNSEHSNLAKQMFNHAYADEVMAYLVPYITECEGKEGASKFRASLKGVLQGKDYESVFIKHIAGSSAACRNNVVSERKIEDANVQHFACPLEGNESLAGNLLARRGLAKGGNIDPDGACSWQVPKGHLGGDICSYFTNKGETTSAARCKIFVDSLGTKYSDQGTILFHETPFAYGLCKELGLNTIQLAQAEDTLPPYNGKSLGCVPPKDLEAGMVFHTGGDLSNDWREYNNHALCVLCAAERAAIKNKNEDYEASSVWFNLLSELSSPHLENAPCKKAKDAYDFQKEYVQRLGFCHTDTYPAPEEGCRKADFKTCYGISIEAAKKAFCPDGGFPSTIAEVASNLSAIGSDQAGRLKQCAKEAVQMQKALYSDNMDDVGQSCIHEFDPGTYPQCNYQLFQSAINYSGNFVYGGDTGCQVAWEWNKDKDQVRFTQRSAYVRGQERIEKVGIVSTFDNNDMVEGRKYFSKWRRTFVGACNGGVPDSCTGGTSDSTKSNGSATSQ